MKQAKLNEGFSDRARCLREVRRDGLGFSLWPPKSVLPTALSRAEPVHGSDPICCHQLSSLACRACWDSAGNEAGLELGSCTGVRWPNRATEAPAVGRVSGGGN